MRFSIPSARRTPWLAALVLTLPCLAAPATAQPAAGDAGAHERTYRRACAACHGVDGAGLPQSVVGFDIALPDFTDCSFATREPDADWGAITSAGGPVRGFHRLMPAFGDALTEEEITGTIAHIRTFCGNAAWPRGELNLPRALFTEKAYPEDEAVLTTYVSATGAAQVVNELL
jgi:mono/diheme cytochrome c family protein